MSRYLAGSNKGHAITARNTCTCSPYSKNGSGYLVYQEIFAKQNSCVLINFAINEFHSSQASDEVEISCVDK